MREGPVLRLGIEVALQASRGQPYLTTLEQGMSSIFGIDAGITLITWDRLDRPGPGRGDLSFIGGRGLTRQQIADATATGPRHPSYQALWQTGTAYPVRTSDHVVLREFWPTDVWRVQHSPSNGRYPIGFVVSSSPTELRFIGMHRSDHDFSDEELSALAAIQTLLVPALMFRSSLDLAASRLLSSAELDGIARTIAHPSGRRKSLRWSHSDGRTTASEDTSGSPNGRYASISQRSTTRPAFPAERQPLPGGRLRTSKHVAIRRPLIMPWLGNRSRVEYLAVSGQRRPMPDRRPTQAPASSIFISRPRYATGQGSPSGATRLAALILDGPVR